MLVRIFKWALAGPYKMRGIAINYLLVLVQILRSQHRKLVVGGLSSDYSSP